MSTLYFSLQHRQQIKDHAQAGYPAEVVGILAGSQKDNQVQLVQTLENERPDTNNRYKVSGLTLYRATQALEAQGYDILGYYHSHPDHPSRYSDYDRDHALPNLSYVIISINQGKSGQIQSWRLAEDRTHMMEETIEMTPSKISTLQNS